MASNEINSVDVNNPLNTRRSVDLLPSYHRTDKNSKFLSSTLDQFIQQPQLERVNGYLGSKLTPNYDPTKDHYLSSNTKLRTDYQLEPSMIIRDVDGNITTALGYDDLIGQLGFHNAQTDNLDRLFRPESFSYNPHINLDKFINFRQYYWLPTGPDSIEIYGKKEKVTSTYSVTDSADEHTLIFTPDGATTNPLLKLYKGLTYIFNVTSKFPFYIKTAYVEGIQSLAPNVIGQGTKNGQVIITVDEFTPSTLYYFAEGNPSAVGKIVVQSITADTFLDVEADIIGKQNYTSYNGVSLSNGMKIRFSGNITPSSYADTDFFVEGVGSEIKLIEYSKLQIAKNQTTNLDVNFDATPFDLYPFDDFEYVPLVPEYVTINRAAPDRNLWSRYNRWVHADVITATAIANGTTPVFQSEMRAQRPIIEFNAGLQLFNYGSFSKNDVDLIDTVTTDPFKIVENSPDFYIDQTLIEAGFRVIFNAAIDPLVKGKIYDVKIAIINGQARINLEESLDSMSSVTDSIFVSKGETFTGTSWRFDGTTWISSQQKTKLNQFPLFDLYDQDGNQFADQIYYKSSFTGTQLFGYQIGTVYDSVLGFNLAYRNVANVGEYLFKNYFMTETFTNFVNNEFLILNVSNGFLKINSETGSKFKTVWTKTIDRPIPIIQYQVIKEAIYYIEINSIDNPGTTTDLLIDVYVNDVKKVLDTDYTISIDGKRAYILSNSMFSINDRILFYLYTSKIPNKNGYYEPPINLTNNPLNGKISDFTFTELSNHVGTMVNNFSNFSGLFPGDGNLRDLKDLSSYGTRLVCHSNPISFSHYFLGTPNDNIINSIRKVSADYNQFKTNLLRNITLINGLYTPGQTLDLALQEINSVKENKSNYNYSDMLAYTNNYTSRFYTVSDPRNIRYSLATIFDDTILSERCVLVYINDVILTKKYDYTVNQYDPSITISKSLSKGDIIEIRDYPSTVGSFIPPTPTKLGLYPKFKPQIFVDDTYISGPQKVIQGHDGSITIAFNDYRDAILLEYETRIYNNIKVNYNQDFIDINEILPGAFRKTGSSHNEVTKLLSADFLRWVGYFGVDYQTNTVYDELNPFTFNYTGSVDTLSNNPLYGFWRNVFKYFYDTDRPNTHPWEMLGFSEQPIWWEGIYGAAPYTSGNAILWNDLEEGRNAFTGVINTLYARPGLSKIIPVDEYGNLLSPTDAGLSTTLNADVNDTNRIIMLRSDQISAKWNIGDQGPAETSWRRSSWWPFVCQLITALSKPANYSALCFDPSRVAKNIAGEYRYGDNLFLNPSNVLLFADSDNGTRVLSSGYNVWVVENGLSKDENYISHLKAKLSNLEYRLMVKLGGFASKDKLQIGIDSVDLTSPYPGELVPSEDYEIFYNVSQPIDSISISGLIIQKTVKGWAIRGYDKYTPYFTIYKPFATAVDQIFRVGGKSKPFISWEPNSIYLIDQIVFYIDRYYRVLQKHTTSSIFVTSYYQSLPSLPIEGGIGVYKRINFNTSKAIIVPYGIEYNSAQEVYDFIVGYGAWLKDNGFVFDEFNNDLQIVLDWDFTAKEFLYWTTQNWAVNSVITLSPFANRLVFQSTIGVVDNIVNSFYEFSLLKADGYSFPKHNFTITRLDGTFQIITVNTREGVFFARLNLIQKEHAIVYNNFTLFNDVIYDIETGYRQRRIKINGFLTSNWNGDFFSPGFIFDQASLSNWEQYTDYKIGDVIRFSGNYYSAKKTIAGTSSFDITQWVMLNEKPTPKLMPNFDYKINQFEDFYSLDIDNFDIAQQAMAQHLTGYTPRPYLNYIISDPIAQYKFYQGMIRDKGTKKSLTSLTKATLNDFRSSIDFNEEWAFRIGSYGGFNLYSELETTLESTKFFENPQIIDFVQNKPTERIDNIYYKDGSELLLTPYNFDITSVFSTTSTSDSFELPVAGYVRIDDITATAFNKNSVLDIANNGSLKTGDTIWLGFKENSDWDVLRITEVPTYIIEVLIQVPGQSLVIGTYYPHQLSAGDLVSITGIDPSINRCYIIQQIIDQHQFIVLSTLTTIPALKLPLSGLIFAFKSSRMGSFDDISSIPYFDRWNYNEKLWVDSDLTGKWSVYKKINNYSSSMYASPISVINGLTISNQYYGSTIASSDDSNILIISAPNFDNGSSLGRLFVLYKDINGILNDTDNFIINDSLIYFNGTGTQFGQSLAYDQKNYMVVAGAPKAGNLKSSFTNTSFIVNPSSGTTESALNQGLVKISLLSTSTYKLLNDQNQVITTPVSQTGTNFGWSLALSTPYVNTTTFKVDNTSNIQIGNLLTGTNILGLPLVTAIGNGNITVSVAQTINTVTELNFNSKVIALSEYAGSTIINVASTAGILLNSYVQGIFIGTTTQVTGIGSGFVTVNTATTINTATLITFVNTSTYGYTLGTKQKLLVGAPSYDSTSTGSVYIFDINASTGTFSVTTGSSYTLDYSTSTTNEYFGTSISGNSALTRVAITAPNYQGSIASGAIYIYDFASTSSIKQIITSADLTLLTSPMKFSDFFANKVKMSADGNFLIVASPFAFDPNIGLNSGVVDIFMWTGKNEQFVHNQRISVPISSITSSTIFGIDIDLNSTNETLVISSVGESKTLKPTFDVYTEASLTIPYVNNQTSLKRAYKTTFDGNSTTWSSKVKNSGTAHVYNKLGNGSTRWAYAQPLINSFIAEGSMYGSSVLALTNSIYVSAPAKTLDNSVGENNGFGKFYEYNKLDTSTNSLSLYRKQDPLIDLTPINRVITIDTLTEEVKDYIDIVDPIKGKILGTAKAELRYISPYDPAVYSLGITGVNVNSDSNWLDEHVGELWWDLSNVKYVWYEQGELEYRKNNWNNIFPGCTIDIYEWVRSKYLPSEWAQLADTADGLTKGISGQPKFNNNSIISIKQVYNGVSNSFSNVYYYWIKNTVIVPANVKNRSLSALEIAKQIANPLNSGSKFMAVLSPTSLMLANTKPAIATETINLNIAFDSNSNLTKRHTEWQLVQENDANVIINSSLEQKLIDSLLGYDILGNAVPDSTLSTREKYGIQIRPRQIMFVDRTEALHNIIEFVNSIFINTLLVGKISFENLNAKDEIPNPSSYDTLVSDIYNLELIITQNFITAELEAIVDSNGRISKVNIIKSGYGYVTAPTITIIDSGSNATLISVIDQFGQITRVDVIEGGKNYTGKITLTVRPYTAVVQTDSNSNNKWAIYEWNDFKKSWFKIRTQDFDTTQYWNYVNWVSLEFDPTIDLTLTVSSPYELQELGSSLIGSYVKVQNGGDGLYLILRKTDGTSGTFDNDWDIMIKQNGTIQISNGLWNSNLWLYGWDQQVGFDQTEYNQTPSREIEYIITAIKNDIFIGEHKIYWNNLFFKAVRYALSEQKNLDWAFKTTFINVINNAGCLDQPATYKLQNIQFYEKYLEEIKPYHTKIRKFTEAYTSTELSHSFNTDFDLPSYYNTVTQSFNTVEFGNILLSQYPWKSWYNNLTYQVNSISLYDGGSGYREIPTITIVPAKGDSGFGATAVAFISLGKISTIIVTNPGSGYMLTPTVVISGGGNTITTARAYAQLGNCPVRSNKIRIRFDRTTAKREIGNQYFTERFPPSDGIETTYKLNWLPVSDKTLITVTRNGILQLIDSFTIEFFKSSYKPQVMTSYTKKFATLKLLFIPDPGDVIGITYPKNLDLYNAADRIEDYYKPKSGMPGNDLAQLMSGVEYSGLQVIGLPFASQGGWDANGIAWGANPWDNLGLEPGYFSVEVTSTSTATLSIPNLISTGTQVNVYVNNKRIDSTNSSSFINTLIGKGTGAISTITMIVTGTGYDSAYTTFSISAPNTLGGRQATAIMNITSGTNISGFTITDSGSGYSEAPIITITESINPSHPTSSIKIKAYAKALLNAEFIEVGSTITNSTITIPSVAFTTSNSLVVFRYSSSDGTILPTDTDSLDAIINGGDLAYTLARGVNPSEIILDGGSTSTQNITKMKDDGFLNPIESYAPEECVPGQVRESLGINVYTQPTFSSPLISNRRYYVDGSQTMYDIGLPPANNESLIALFNDSTLQKTSYSINYANNTLSFKQDPGKGWLSITTMQVGSVQFLDSFYVNSALNPIVLTSEIAFADVGSSYVTVNGVSIASSATNYPGMYTLSNSKGSAQITVNTSGTVQAYLFMGTTKSFSEVKEELITLNGSTVSWPLSNLPGNSGPLHNQVIVTINDRRLRPPVSTYFTVVNGQLLFDISKSIQFPYGRVDLNHIELYLNGILFSSNRHWKLDQNNNQVEFRKNILNDGDEIAIIVKEDNEYLIQNGNLVLTNAGTTGDIIKVMTFTNHDPNFIRSEVYNAIAGNQYFMQRSVSNAAYVWVTYKGKPLTVNLDYTIGTDGRTVSLREGIFQNQNDTVIITSFADTDPMVAHRIFVDLLGRTHFKRLSNLGSTQLTQHLYITDEIIHVKDASKLTPPDPIHNRPGVILINGERIEFFVIINNQLRQLRRSTLGTGSKDIYYAGTTVIDQGLDQTIPFIESKQTTSTFVITSTSTTAFNGLETTYSLDGWIDLTPINDIYGRSTPAAIDQIEVRYQGIKLLKPNLITYKHNIELAYDSTTELNSTSTIDVLVPYGFSINTLTNSIVLNTATIILVKGAKLEVIKRTSTSWYSNTATTLAQSTTIPAKFLSKVPAALPRFVTSTNGF